MSSIQELILLVDYIEEQIELSDSGNNHEPLNGLYYDLYLLVRRYVKWVLECSVVRAILLNGENV